MEEHPFVHETDDAKRPSARAEPEEMTVRHEHARLLEFLYNAPVGLAECASDGTVRMMNAAGVQILMRLDPTGRCGNILDALEPHSPALRALVGDFSEESGLICEDCRIRTQPHPAQESRPLYLGLTVRRLDGDTLMFALVDVSSAEAAEERARAAIHAEALQAGRMETATTILHDIGNAMTSVATTLASMLGDPPWGELKQIGRLHDLMVAQQAGLVQVFGERRAMVLPGFIKALDDALSQRRQHLQETVQVMARGVGHLQEILAIQRQYLDGGTRTPSSFAVKFVEVVDIALALTSSAMSRRNVVVSVAIPTDLQPIRGDRTQLVQVMLNILRNAAEAFDDALLDRERRVEITALQLDGIIRVRVRDNGVGFSSAVAGKLFGRGFSTKPRGSGLGLSGCRAILASHHAEMALSSPGPGQGAEATLTLRCEAH